jgi:outer membrane protein
MKLGNCGFKKIRMMELFKKWGLILGVVVAVVFSVAAFFRAGGSRQVAYVRMDELYNDFALKQQLESKLKETEKARQFIVDSLKLQLRQMTTTMQALGKIDTAMLRNYNLKQTYLQAQQAQFDQDNQVLAQQYTDQIWGQINQYTRDFGKEKGYNFIFGASGDGALMYASEGQDITLAVKNYINQRFNGKTK